MTSSGSASTQNGTTIIALDVGTVRIGVAIARLDIRIPQPLVTLPSRHEIFDDVAQLVREHDAAAVVVGWPRGLEGQITAQTKLVEDFVDELRKTLPVSIYLQDEALTSHQAETELSQRKKSFEKAEVDALAATYILEDYLGEGAAHV